MRIIVQVNYITIKVQEFRSGTLINETLISHVVYCIGRYIISGITESIKNNLFAFPVPVSDVLHLELPFGENVKVTSATGQVKIPRLIVKY